MQKSDVPRRILIVDDEENVCHALRRSLRKEGYELFFGHEPAEGLEVLKRQPVDMVISDHLMPNMTGLEFLKISARVGIAEQIAAQGAPAAGGQLVRIGDQGTGRRAEPQSITGVHLRDIDPRDRAFTTGARTPEGYFFVKPGIESAIARSLAYAPYADLLWFETSKPDLEEARRFAEEIHAKHPGKLLAYNCSPSFNWKKHLDDATIAKFQKELGAMGYKFQFITLAGWHLINYHSFDLAQGYKETGMSAYVELQEAEFAAEKDGYTATKHQREVGTGYFDEVLMAITSGQASTSAMSQSTEAEQFH
jgi:isocitrate lyase